MPQIWCLLAIAEDMYLQRLCGEGLVDSKDMGDAAAFSIGGHRPHGKVVDNKQR